MQLLDFDWEPWPAIVAAEYDTLGLAIDTFEKPLEEAVQRVMAPSLGRNFDVGGRPTWAPLSSVTLAIKAKKGYSGGTLKATGALASGASSPALWRITSDTASLDNLPTDYAGFHQSGTRKMPQREWAVIQDEDADAVEELFDKWLLSEIETAIKTGLV